MSVMVGTWNFDGEPVNRDLMTGIAAQLAEYGPDKQTIYIDGPIGMLYQALYTQPDEHLEKQPYISSCGTVSIWVGRLDNRAQLLQDMHDDVGKDQSDVAVAAAVYERWGTHGFRSLIGDWALAIWDASARELVLARDYIGTRHLFYKYETTGVVWCNHLEPLVLCGGKFSLCEEYIAGYLALHPDARLTPYNEIHSVPPGQFVVLRKGTRTTGVHWAFNSEAKTRFKSDAEYEERFRALLRQSLRRRLRSNGPVLIELSGGWDSSSLVCMTDDISRQEGGDTSIADTFSYYDSREPGEDDLAHLLAVERQRSRSGFHVDLAGAGNSLDFENTTFVAVPGFITRSEIKTALNIPELKTHRVMISGTGGDEMNGQALNPRVMLADLILQGRLHLAWNELAAWSRLLRRPLIQLLSQTLLELCPLTVRARFTELGKVEPWVNTEFAKRYKLSARQIEPRKSRPICGPAVRDASQTIAALGNGLTSLPPSTLEYRYPYLDRDLVEFLTSIPLEQLLRPGQRRFLMRRSLADLLPPTILSRKSKAAAQRCYSITLEKHWGRIEQLLQDPLISRLGYVEATRMYSTLSAMKHGRIPAHFLRLFKALSLEIWIRDLCARNLISSPPDYSSTKRKTGATTVGIGPTPRAAAHTESICFCTQNR